MNNVKITPEFLQKNTNPLNDMKKKIIEIIIEIDKGIVEMHSRNKNRCRFKIPLISEYNLSHDEVEILILSELILEYKFVRKFKDVVIERDGSNVFFIITWTICLDPTEKQKKIDLINQCIPSGQIKYK
jgi:hypothetical protein